MAGEAGLHASDTSQATGILQAVSGAGGPTAHACYAAMRNVRDYQARIVDFRYQKCGLYFVARTLITDRGEPAVAAALVTVAMHVIGPVGVSQRRCADLVDLCADNARSTQPTDARFCVWRQEVGGVTPIGSPVPDLDARRVRFDRYPDV